MARKSRDKGKRGEREAVALTREVWPDVRRRAMQSRGGHEGADLDNTPGFHIEVGVGQVNPRTKWEQAYSDHAKFETVPIALTRKDHGPWLVTLSWDAFRSLLAHGTAREGYWKAQGCADGGSRPVCVSGDDAPRVEASDASETRVVEQCDKKGAAGE